MPPRKRPAKAEQDCCCAGGAEAAQKSKRQLTVDAFFGIGKAASAGTVPPDATEHIDSTRSAMQKRLAKFVGAHVSAAGGVHNAFSNACNIHGRAFALFLKNQRRWDSKPYTEDQVALFKKECSKSNITLDKILPHGSYLINLANPDAEKRKKSLEAFIDDLQRCHILKIPLYNLHPGSTVGECSVKEAIAAIAEGINEAHRRVPDVCVVLETMAGQGNCVGNRFEDLRDIIALVDDKKRVGVCIDTCHIFAAGYDIRTEAAYVKTMRQFDSIIGFGYLRGVHLNDSKTPLSSGTDRHENIGKGHIGIAAFRFIMNDPRFDNVPMILETPVSDGQDESLVYKAEIDLLYDLVEGPKTVE